MSSEEECAFECVRGYFAGEAGCEECRANCGVGSTVVSVCSQTSDLVCEPCGDVPGATFAVVNSCAAECFPEYRFNAAGTACTACTVCGIGTFSSRECGVAGADNVCSPCQNAPTLARYTGVGVDVNSCAWECDEGYDRVDDMCTEACLVGADCLAGETLEGSCDSGPRPTCSSCGVLPRSAVYTTANSCESMCGPGNFADGLGECAPCSSCSIGEYPTSLCNASADIVCSVCDSTGDDVYFTSVGQLNQPGSCLESLCTTSCAQGVVLVGACGATSNPVCTSAEQLPALVPNSSSPLRCSSAASCEFVCNDEFYRSGDECAQCVTSCPPGRALAERCSPDSNNECIPCPGALPANAFYDDSGECVFSCEEGYFRNSPTTCTQCVLVESCASGTFLDGECSGTSNTFCRSCVGLRAPQAALERLCIRL